MKEIAAILEPVGVATLKTGTSGRRHLCDAADGVPLFSFSRNAALLRPHHTDNDTFDKIEPHSLDRMVAAVAASLLRRFRPPALRRIPEDRKRSLPSRRAAEDERTVPRDGSVYPLLRIRFGPFGGLPMRKPFLLHSLVAFIAAASLAAAPPQNTGSVTESARVVVIEIPSTSWTKRRAGAGTDSRRLRADRRREEVDIAGAEVIDLNRTISAPAAAKDPFRRHSPAARRHWSSSSTVLLEHERAAARPDGARGFVRTA